MPAPISSWQFNLNFDLSQELINTGALNLLRESGIDFGLLSKHGIDPIYLGERLTTSGLVYNENLTWICFHGASDMGYMYKLLTCDKMPTRDVFRDQLKIIFPKLLDLKTLQECYYSHLRGGLNFIS